MVFFKQFLITLTVIIITEASLDNIHEYCKVILTECTGFENVKIADSTNVKYEDNLESNKLILREYVLKLGVSAERNLPKESYYVDFTDNDIPLQIGKNLAAAYKDYAKNDSIDYFCKKSIQVETPGFIGNIFTSKKCENENENKNENKKENENENKIV
ncbi:uncharacterized protein LOC100302439 precursor [Acyrthosiphon pisum]|uniref:ACYPI24906 protein n=1 Tax=Acyrthosiphon pisum TaxID=7029 RepID=C4WX66_ACYPI|nr:uncharacterized protein LOC100302439 precursor [Acyrthosiphon pisum]BAH72486.1 ACYPI24906 [Acyrthosiphon pisum]|eukprot:XP_016659404.1 PREDICTED: uncharacterized protein LOC100302439 [Acyrthosiphon pisum]